MLIIKEVISRRDEKIFTRLPVKLFKSVDAFSPALEIDEITVFNKKKNPMLSYCKTIRYIAYLDGKPVGRIAGIINELYNKEKGIKQARFNRIDFIDSFEVAKVLIETIEKWAINEGMDEIIGPMGFSDFDKMGLLVSGFEYDNTFITIWNPPYYEVHLNKLGYKEDVRWLENRIYINSNLPERVVKAAKIARDRYGYELVIPKNKKETIEYAYPAFKMYNEAFSKLYGFYPMNLDVQKYYIDQMKVILVLDYVWFVKDKTGEIIGMGIMMPSLSKAMKKSNGRLLPKGIFGILKALKKHEVVDLYFIAVDPKHQNRGIPALMIADGHQKLLDYGVLWAETGPELSTNHQVHAIWKQFDSLLHRQRISMFKKL